MLRLVLFLTCAGLPTVGPASQPRPTEGTRRMVARLEKFAADMDPDKNPYLNVARVRLAQEKVKKATALNDQVLSRMELAQELILAGKPAEGTKILEGVRHSLEQLKANVAQRTQDQISELLVIGHLRRAEQENCVLHHGTDSCLMPIKGGGVHTEQTGSLAAVVELHKLLEHQPDNLSFRWLLNIAAMTLGEYPEKVPPKWLIPPAAFKSDIDFLRFYDIAVKMGVAGLSPSGGAILDDFDNDGHLDLVTSSWQPRDPLRYFHNDADGGFTERTEAAGLTGEVGGLNIVQTDYNNDGFVDILVLRGAWLREAGHAPNSLLKNNGDGTFDDVTEAAGLLSFHPTQTGMWADFDNDGHLDLFIGNETTRGDEHACELFHNNGDGTFTDVAAMLHVDIRKYVKGVAWGDYNNDDRPDLYLSCLGQPNILFRNDGPVNSAANGGKPPRVGFGKQRAAGWKFTDVTAEAGVAMPLRSFPCWFFDYDNDGWLDLMVCSFAGFSTASEASVCADYLGLPNDGARPVLYHNNRDGTFTDVTKPMKLDTVLLAMGSNYGDLDNDGWSDMYIGTGQPSLTSLVPNRMFRNDGGKIFQDITTIGGFGHLQKGHGVAFGDIDNDGDQDIYEVMGGAYEGDVFQNTLFENPGFPANHWIKLKLEGVQCNRPGIGSRLRVTVAAPAGPRDIHIVVNSGGSFGASTLRKEIGLGNATGITSLEITWAGSGTKQTFKNVTMDRAYRIREGDSTPHEIPLKTFKLTGK